MEIINYPIPKIDINVSDSDEEYKYEDDFFYKTDFL